MNFWEKKYKELVNILGKRYILCKNKYICGIKKFMGIRLVYFLYKNKFRIFYFEYGI